MTKTTSDANGLGGGMLAQSDGGPTPEPTRGGAASGPGYVRMLRLVQVLEMTGLARQRSMNCKRKGNSRKGCP